MREFEQIGKKLPYTVPENFFELSRQTIMTAVVESECRRLRVHRYLLRASWASVAAAIMVIVSVIVFDKSGVVNAPMQQASTNVSIDDVLRTMTDDDLSRMNSTLSNDYYIAQN